MQNEKPVKTRRSYDADFKQEVVRVLASGRSPKIYRRHLELPRMWIATPVLYCWKRMAIKKTKSNTGENINDESAKRPKSISYVLKMSA